MKRFTRPLGAKGFGRATCRSALILALLSLGIVSLPNTAAADAPKSFSSPDKAVAALVDAVRNKNLDALLSVLGPSTREWLISGDKVQDQAARARFIAAYDAKHGIAREGDAKAVLVIGDDDYPFAIPLVKGEKGWAFDPEQGREEILDRRIGENELNTIQTLRAIADAQREYAGEDRNGNGLLEYAAKFRSAEGKRDGLYWPTDDGEPLSPLGPLVIEATAEGYAPRTSGTGDGGTNAFHGYRFKLLKKQGAEANGGAHDYVVDGKMIGGFAVLAYPAKYGASGIMTFVINHDGVVFETDLGPETELKAKEIDRFNPDKNWKKSETQ
ncbi:MAG: DUF2950 domain-containing protein [Hyphomicrobiaceae bacterium]|nr:DUF2950 domain-containing protein [Hyphomicrobiaceae bacterium]